MSNFANLGWSEMLMVALIGFLLVFVVLVLLIYVMRLMGWFFTRDRKPKAVATTSSEPALDHAISDQELAAAIITDSVVRLLPGAIGDEASALTDCFQDDLLAPPVYTRPADFNGWKVPEVLTSGNFAEIAKWQEEQAYERTKALRPDLLE